SFASLLPPPPTSTLFPYTTLFRSSLHYRDYSWLQVLFVDIAWIQALLLAVGALGAFMVLVGALSPAPRRTGTQPAGPFVSVIVRSEEHTSELQSRFDLVCRLLLEK